LTLLSRLGEILILLMWNRAYVRLQDVALLHVPMSFIKPLQDTFLEILLDFHFYESSGNIAVMFFSFFLFFLFFILVLFFSSANQLYIGFQWCILTVG